MSKTALISVTQLIWIEICAIAGWNWCSYRHFGTAYQRHQQRSISLRPL